MERRDTEELTLAEFSVGGLTRKGVGERRKGLDGLWLCK